MPDALKLSRLWKAIGYALILLVVYQSLNRQPIEITVVEGNLLGHLVAYGTLMLWFAQIHSPGRARTACAAGFVLLGLGLEVAQGFTDYRTFDLFDAGANASGVALGWLLAPPRLPNFLRMLESLRFAKRDRR